MFHRSAPLNRACLLGGLMVLGFAGGRVMRSSSGEESLAPSVRDVVPSEATRSEHLSVPDNGPPAWTPMPEFRSTDKVSDLAALHEDELYDRLALWLVDATVEEMAAYWAVMRENEELPSRFRDLLFVRWTALDPAGAIEAAARTPYAHIPWWAWAKNDSDAAFREAVDHGRDHVDWVLRSIGQKDPERALRLLDGHPGLAPSTGLEGIVFGLAREDPGAAVALEHERGGDHDSTALEAWLRDDPHAAFDWFVRHRDEFGEAHADWRRQAVIKALARENPELLGEFAAGLPQGALRRELEVAAFDRLLATDPERALATAADHPSPNVAVSRLAKAALASDDPARVGDVMSEILGISPDPLYERHPVFLPEGLSIGGRMNDEAALLLERMVAEDPHRLMEAMVAANPGDSWNQSTERAAELWMERNPDAFGAWASGLGDEGLRVKALGRVTEHLRTSGGYAAAMRHAAMLPEAAREQELRLIEENMKAESPEGSKPRPDGNDKR